MEFNYATLLLVCYVNLNESVAGNILWPVFPFFVGKYFAPVDTGIMVGLLGSSYFFGQVVCIRQWGWAADRYGRRPVLLLGLLGSCVTLLWFGFARSFTEALLARFLCGVLNGNVAITKIYVGEVCNTSKTQARGFSWLSMTWGLGNLVAPALGGILSDPAPGSIFDSPLTRAFPFCLPSLVSAAFSLVCFLLSLRFLQETPAWIRRSGSKAYAQMGGEVGGEDADTSEEGGEESALKGSASRAEKRGGGSTTQSFPSKSPAGVGLSESVGGGSDGRVKLEDEEGDEGGEEEVELDVEALGEGTPSKHHRPVQSLPTPYTSLITPESSTLTVLRDPLVGPSILTYASLALLQVVFDELLPTFCATSREAGGLNWSSMGIGEIQIVNGAVQIIATLFIVPVLQRRMGMLRSFQFFVALLVPYFIAFPMVARLSEWPTLLYIAMSVSVGLRTFLFALPFSSIMIIINNLSPPASLGIVVGIAQGAASFIRTLGPTMGGGLFSASVASEWLGLWRLEALYVFLALVSIVTVVLSRKISPACELPPKEEGVLEVAGGGKRAGTLPSGGQGRGEGEVLPKQGQLEGVDAAETEEEEGEEGEEEGRELGKGLGLEDDGEDLDWELEEEDAALFSSFAASTSAHGSSYDKD
jgi:MFS family permease